MTWNEPGNTGPPITDYDVQCQNCPEIVSHDGADRSMIITGLTPGTRYDVQVRVWNAEGHSDWSRSGTGTPNADVTNQDPLFSGGARTIEVAENTVAAGDPIGNPVSAVDPDQETVTHTLEGLDATSFTIDAGSGQIRATAALNHEEKSSYSVTVRATDTRGGSATVGVTITVTDVDGEAPATPAAPTVAAASSTSLAVSWDAPENTGPPITDYDYRYRETSRVLDGGHEYGDHEHDGHDSGSDRQHVLRRGGAGDERGGHERLVEFRVRKDQRAWREHPAHIPRGCERHAKRVQCKRAGRDSPIGQPVTATDSDPGDTLTYSLAGARARPRSTSTRQPASSSRNPASRWTGAHTL